MQSIGIALIARNAESTIRNCIESFIEEVDQTVVVLAGESTDKTEEIVRSIDKVEVYNFDWIDDFSAARNFSFSKLHTDWLMWIDSDDEMYQPENLRLLVENAKEEVGAIWLPYHYALDEFGNVSTVYERERLLRAKYGWVWKGRLHETVSSLQKCILVRSNEVIIRHDHRAGGSRNDRNFKLLNLMKEESPEDMRVWLYLGHQHFAAGDWMEASEWYLKFGSDKRAVPLERYQSLCYGAKALRSLEDKQTIDVALMAIELYPSFKDAYLEMAQSYLMLGDYDKAIHWAFLSDTKDLIKEPPPIIFVNPLDYTFNKYALLSECYLKKGEWDTALGYIQEAYKIRPVTDIENNIKYIRGLKDRSKITDSIKSLAVTLLNNREILKLPSLLDAVPYWFRDLDDYKELEAGVSHYFAEAKDEPQTIEGDNNSILLNLGHSMNPEKLLEDADKYDKVTIVAPMPDIEPKQINTYSQTDIERLVTTRKGRHIVNLQREPSRIICEYDKNVPKHLCIRYFLGQGLENWSIKTIRENGCGGSEIWAAMTAKELAQRDCQPIIYAMDNQVWDGVLYRNFKDFSPKSMGCNVFISSRVPEVFYNDTESEQKWLWAHDICFGDRFTPEIAERIDCLVALSQWHAGHLKRCYPFLKDAEIIDMDNNKLTYDDQWKAGVWYEDAKISNVPKIAIIGNGMDTKKFEVQEDKIPHRFIWCSSPDRGLEQVLNMWPLIKKSLPDAELKVFYGWEYFNSALWIPGLKDMKQRIKQLIRQEGVEWCGRVGQEQLAREYLKADILLYPPPHDFRETYGIAFLEAQAAGTLCFYRENGALGETIGKRGIPLRLDMTPEEIVEKITNVIIDKEYCDKFREKGKKYALKRTWASQADKMLELYKQIGV